MKSNILLIHGGLHKANCWDLLIPFLQKKGLRVNAIDLPGHGRNSTFYYDISLDTYAEDICFAAKKMGTPCIAIGHSFGGISLSLAAEKNPSLFSRLIYLTALIPNAQYSRGIKLARDFVNPSNKKALKTSLLRGCIVPRADYLIDYFYHDCPENMKQRASEYLCNQPLLPMLNNIKLTTGRINAIPKHYIECTRDVVMPISGQRTLQSHMKFDSVQTLQSGHSPFISMPAELADCIIDLVS